MLNLETIENKIKDAVKATQITDIDQLNDIINSVFPSDEELKSTIDHVHSIKPFNTKPKEFVTELVKRKIRNAMMEKALLTYESLQFKSKFTMEEVEDEDEFNYYDYNYDGSNEYDVY